MANPETDIDYSVGGGQATRIDSLADAPDGPMKATHEHLFCKLIGGYAAGQTTLPQRVLEYIVLGPMIIAPDLVTQTNPWHILPNLSLIHI